MLSLGFLLKAMGLRVQETNRGRRGQAFELRKVPKCDCGRTLWSSSEIACGYCATCQHRKANEPPAPAAGP